MNESQMQERHRMRDISAEEGRYRDNSEGIYKS